MKTGRRGFFRMVAAAIAGAGATAAADSPLRGLAGVPSHPNCGYSWVPVGEGYPPGAKNYISGGAIASFSIENIRPGMTEVERQEASRAMLRVVEDEFLESMIPPGAPLNRETVLEGLRRAHRAGYVAYPHYLGTRGAL